MLKGWFKKDTKVHKKQAKGYRNGYKVEPEELDGFVVVTTTEKADKSQVQSPTCYDSLTNMGAQQSNDSANASGIQNENSQRPSANIDSGEAVLNEQSNSDTNYMMPNSEQTNQSSAFSPKSAYDDVDFKLSPELCAMLDMGHLMRDQFAIQPLREFDRSKYDYDFSLEKSVLRDMKI